MPATNDKRIANWLGLSIQGFYRWRHAGLLPRRPRSAQEAHAMLEKIAAARDAALLGRPPNRIGRTSLEEVAHALRGER
jgi:hypothetical protein